MSTSRKKHKLFLASSISSLATECATRAQTAEKTLDNFSKHTLASNPKLTKTYDQHNWYLKQE